MLQRFESFTKEFITKQYCEQLHFHLFFQTKTLYRLIFVIICRLEGVLVFTAFLYVGEYINNCGSE